MNLALLICALALPAASAFSLLPPAPSARPALSPLMSTAVSADGLLAVPHGGSLVELMLPPASHAAEVSKAKHTLQLSPRQLCDVELIMNGGFSPLTGFMNEATYNNVVEKMELPGGLLFGLPVIFDTDDEALQPGDTALLRDGDRDIAVVTFTDKYLPNKPLETLKCYGTSSLEHPGTLMVATERGKYYMGGEIKGLNLPVRDFVCATPKEVRAGLPKGKDVVAFQCRNPVHRAHYELFTRALDAPNLSEDSVVLVHPTCGPTQADDIPGIVRYKTYEVLKEETKNPRTQWAYLPYSMHMAGPREAIQHAMIRKNYGCTAFIIGRDMAGSKSSLSGDDFYGAYDAQDLLTQNSERLGVKAVPSLNLVFTEEEGYVTADDAKAKGLEVKKLSGTAFRKALRAGEDIPEWFAFKSVVKVLRENA
ncbi:hypothetical protein TeGR_g10641 [Tetraparma gracilis]|uniref:sulfate adenylyltransferase n=1 Tax=Tetraparma gracilis TaxID=2962635 RepID=A0ABQ6MLJ2_9STRA|nr:hypothetical protein TeGR_g10641 [Tetraparma gracilis]